MAPAPLERMRASLAPLASASALSWPVLALFCPLLIALQAFVPHGAEGGSVALWALASIISMPVLVAVILAARWLACRHGDPPLAVVVAAYAVSLLAQITADTVVARYLAVVADPSVGYRLFAAVIALTPLMMLVGFAVATHAAHRRVIADLEQKRARLLAYGPSLEAELDRQQAELAGAVRASVTPALSSLDVALRAAARRNDDTAALDALDAIIEGHLRPITQELVAAGTEPSTGDFAAAARPPARVPLPRRFTVADGMRPAAVAIALVITVAPSGSRVLAPGPLLAYLSLLAVICWAGLWAARRGFGRTGAPTPVGVAAIVGVHAVVCAAAFSVIGVLGVAPPVGIAVAAVILMGAIGGLVVSSMLVGQRRGDSEARLAAATERLERAVALTLRRQRLVRRRLAFVLHGSLQGALYAATLRVGESAHIDAAVAEEIRSDVAAALMQLEAPRGDGESCLTTAAIDDLGEIWQGRRRVIARIGPGVDEALRADADADEAVAEVVQEAVNNAFRHGGATQVDVDVQLMGRANAHDQPTIVVVARDDGSGRATTSTPGLGTLLFDDVCQSWTHECASEGSTFRAQVALAAPNALAVS